MLHDQINKVYAQAKILNLIKQILIGTDDIRAEDMHRIADNINDMLTDALLIKKNRQKFLFGIPRGTLTKFKTRTKDVKHIDLRG